MFTSNNPLVGVQSNVVSNTNNGLTGFEQLSQRIAKQQELAKKYSEYEKRFSEQLRELAKNVRLTDIDIQRCHSKQKEVFHKIVILSRKVECLKCFNQKLGPEERQLKESFLQLASILTDPSPFYKKLEEISSYIPQNNEVQVPEISLTATEKDEVLNILRKQYEGVQSLKNTLQRCRRDVSIVKEGLNASRPEE